MKKIIILILFILFYYFILLQEKKRGRKNLENIWKPCLDNAKPGWVGFHRRHLGFLAYTKFINETKFSIIYSLRFSVKSYISLYLNYSGRL